MRQPTSGGWDQTHTVLGEVYEAVREFGRWDG